MLAALQLLLSKELILMENISSNKKAATMALIMGTLAMLVSFMAWSSISPLAKVFATDLHVNIGYQKVLVAIPVLLGSIMRLPMGILSDKFGGKKVYLFLMGFTLLPLIATPLVINAAKSGLANTAAVAAPTSYYWLMIFVALLLGMAGTSFAVSISYVSVWFPKEKQGQILGITGMGNIGNAVAALLLPTIAGPTHNLSTVYFFLVALTVVFMLIFAFTTTEMPTNKEKTVKEALSVAKNMDTWYLALFYMLTFGSFVAFGTLLPTLLSNPKTFNVALVSAGLLSAMFSAIATIIRPFGGTLADKIRPATLLFWAFLGILVSSVMLFFAAQGTGNLTLFIAAIVIEAIFAGLGNGIVFKMVPYVAKGNTGAVTGFVGAMGGLGGFFPPLVVAAFSNNLAMCFFFLGGFTVICGIVLVAVYFRGNHHTVEE